MNICKNCAAFMHLHGVLGECHRWAPSGNKPAWPEVEEADFCLSYVPKKREPDSRGATPV